MSDEYDNSPPPMPQLPDGIGLDHDQVVKLLAEKHKTIVSSDDPVLMMVTLHNAWLAEENKLMARHKKALAHVLAERTDNFVKAVETVAGDLGRTLSTSTLEAMQATFVEHNKALVSHQANIRWLSAIAAVSALVNVAVFVGLFWLR